MDIESKVLHQLTDTGTDHVVKLYKYYYGDIGMVISNDVDPYPFVELIMAMHIRVLKLEGSFWNIVLVVVWRIMWRSGINSITQLGISIFSPRKRRFEECWSVLRGNCWYWSKGLRSQARPNRLGVDH